MFINIKNAILWKIIKGVCKFRIKIVTLFLLDVLTQYISSWHIFWYS